MIPRTFPSSVASNGATQMIVYFLPSVAGLTRWVDYIPVKFTTVATATTENTYNQNGYIPVVSLSSIAGATPFREYVPVFLDSNAADADVWDVTITGFIPVGTAGIGGAALYLDFAATTTLDPRITFSRTTNATVTGSNGLLQFAPHNLLTHSESFDNAAWSKDVSLTVAANVAAAPDGTFTADLVTPAANDQPVSQLASTGSALGRTFTFSIYLRADTPHVASLRMLDNVNAESSVLDVNVTTSWQRFSITYTWTTGTGNVNCLFYAKRFGSGDANLPVQAWGAQMNVGALQPYNPTTVKNLLGFAQEFDNAAWTKSNSFVQTNLLTFSQDFENAAWGKTSTTATSNNAVAPDGSNTAETLTDSLDASPTVHALQANGNFVSGTSYTASFYAKQGTLVGCLILFPSTAFTSNLTARFRLDTGTVAFTDAGVTAVITDVGNGWYRCSATATATSSATAPLQFRTATSTASFYQGTGNGTIQVWGAQLVRGATAGDYQVTYGTARAVMYPAPDGSITADKLVENTANNTHTALQTASVIAGTSYTFSAYLKAAEETTATLAISASPFPRVKFDLAAGTIVSSQGGGTGTIVPAGNGWYRCSMTSAAPTTSGVSLIAIRDIDNNYTGNGTNGILIWGAQLSDSASLDPYVYNPVAAPASTAYFGPRFDYDPVTLAPRGLLIEEQRTNLLTFSEQIDNIAWSPISGATVQANVTAAPDGATTADRITEDTTNAEHGNQTPTASFVAGTTYTFSVYAKQSPTGAARNLRVLLPQAAYTENKVVWFDLSNGSIVSTSGTGITASANNVGNGWWRVTVSAAATVTITTLAAQLRLVTTGTTTSYTGNGTSGLFIWGAQLEAGAFATSYIPTTTAAATRAADVATMIGANFSNWYNQTEGTLFVDGSVPYVVPSGSFPTYASISDGTANNRIDVGYVTSAVAGLEVVAGGASQAGMYPPVGTAARKVAGAYQVNNFAISANSGTVLTDTAGTIPVVDRMRLGDRSGVTLNGHIRRIAYYPRRLANTELQTITS